MLEPRGSLGAVCVGRTLVAVSGSGIASNLDTCELLPLTDEALPSSELLNDAPPSSVKPATAPSKWVRLPGVTTARHALAAASIPATSSRPAKIYAVGGWKYGDRVCQHAVVDFVAQWRHTMITMVPQACNSTESLVCAGVPGENSWQWRVHTPMNTARKLHGLVSHGGKLYVFGGMTVEGGHRPVTSCEVYDPADDTWSNIAPLPVGACVYVFLGIRPCTCNKVSSQ